MRYRYMKMFVVLIAVSAFVAACDSNNDCESYYENLCSYDSYATDKDESVAKSHQEFCTCMTEGPDSLDSEYQKLACTARLEQTAALDPMVENDAAALMECRARGAMLDKLKDGYITTCYQTDGDKECTDALDACGTACADSCKGDCDVSAGGYSFEKCQACGEPCYTECSRKYPCDEMCG